MRHVIIRSLLAAAIGCGCVFDSDAAVYVECDEGAQCWTFVEGWADWAYTLTAERVAALEGTGALAPIGGASECWQVASIALPICAVDVDGARVFGHPDEIGQDHGIVLEPSDCARPDPWDYTATGRGMCFGVIGGIAVQLDRDRPLPSDT